MDANWDFCLKAILEQEGGNDDDPHDPGGRTSRGILQREYNAWCRSCGKPQGDVWKASDQDVATIYKTQYWQPQCLSMPSGVDLVYFDMNVNSGAHEAALILQRSLGVTADGHIGIVTMDALTRVDPGTIVQRFSINRLTFYRGLKTFKYFGKGWTRRVSEIQAQALTLVH